MTEGGAGGARGGYRERAPEGGSAQVDPAPADSLEQLRARERRWLVHSYARLPVEFVRGRGARLWDRQGNEYLDFLSGISVLNTGHCHPHVLAAIAQQSAQLMHVSNLFYSEPQIHLAERLAVRSLGGRVFFCNSGAEANEAAIKLARKARREGEIVVVRGGFHGRTYGALSATPQEAKQAPFAPLVPGFRAIAPDPEQLRAVVGQRTAAVLLEPIQGESGVHVLPLELLQAARSACDEHQAALIFDEVQCGMGRTGSLWAYQQTGVVPDAITVAKALGGGLPIGALITGERLAEVLEPGDHGSTFGGTPLVAAAALAALEVIDDPELLASVARLGELLAAALAELPGVLAVRGRGLMLGCELECDAREVVRRCLQEQRLVVNATGPTTLRLLPPLVIGEAEALQALERLSAVLSKR